MAEVAVALRISPEEVWTMDLADYVTVVDVLTAHAAPRRPGTFDFLAD